ncbi:hypothetical protein C2E23DRAFT_882337 [Lenzites betulinus]|nr:hypothetical protein C2E23DRAFT_882337 [Lenzites betulinus]
MHVAGRTTPRPAPTPLRPRLPLRRAYREVPEEIWLMVFGYLSKDDLLNLARVAKFIGAVAESRLYREAQLSRLNFVFWSVAVSVPHRASAVRVLTLSLAGKEGIFPTSGVVSRLGATLRSLPDLRELSVLGVKLLTSEYRNILSGVSFTRLRKFACDSDELVLASWASLAEQKELEDFRGLYRHDTHLPSNIRPGVWPKLRILETGAVFLERIDEGSQITHLSTYLPRMTASRILQRVTETLGGHLIGLRVIRTILAPRSGGIHWFVEPQLNTDLYWESDSPVALCGALRAPALKFLELRDISPAKRSWATNTESLREQRRFGRAFRSSQRQDRSPSLEMLLWRPVWGDAAQPLPGIVRDNILDMLHILPAQLRTLGPFLAALGHIMASFLSKVFPRKKEKDTNKRASVSSLLEGKFEAVSPTVSPSAAKFEEAGQKPADRGREKEKDKEKDTGFSLFRPRTRPLSPPPDTRQTATNVPRLTLNLPVPKEERSRALGVVFEGDPDAANSLPDHVIGERRLNPLEALLLVKACSTAIVANGGLETLGVMHPFWYSASPEAQRKLISLFILSLAPKSPITTLSPSPNSALSSFDTELQYTRSPHDVAAVLRWALRHLRLEGDSFGRVDEKWKWYQAFAEAERASSYVSSAFSDALAPQLPPTHLQLLITTLDIVSSLAAHSEHNGISGSKLSKFFGLWLLTTTRSEQGDDWSSFYARWEQAGRILEHLFLAYIRDEAARKKIPLRLSELVKGYPYHSRTTSTSSAISSVATTDVDLLPRPRISTRQYDALYVRIDTTVNGKPTKQKQHPLRLISDALKSEVELEDTKFQSVWEALKKNALANDEPEPILTHVDGYPSVSRIFADETIRLLSLIPAESSNAAPSVPTIRVPRPPAKRASSIKSNKSAKAKANGNGKAPTNGSATTRATTTPTSPTAPGSPKDWMDFSSSGFGDTSLGKDFAKTLLDKDVEVTVPPPTVERKSSRKRKASPGRSRGSSFATTEPEPQTRAPVPPSPLQPKSKSTAVSVFKLDEAFIDFWSDALLDPISSDWPNFVVAQLKAFPGLEADGKPIGWLVLEQRFVAPRPPPPATAESEAAIPPPPKRASSPRPSMRSELSSRRSSTLAAAKKRLTFFSSSQTLGGLSSKAESKGPARKKAKPARIGEMGEILPEVEDEKAEEKVENKQPAKKEEAAAGPSTEAASVPSAEAPKTEVPAVPELKEPAGAAAQCTTVPTILEAPASPTSDVMSPLTPTADDFPAVPVVGGLVASAAAVASIASVEPLKTEDAPAEDKPVLAVAEEPVVPADSTPSVVDEAEIPQEKTLPPAPEPVVLTGETPGPQVALSTSEPAALAELSTKIDEVVAQAAEEASVPAPTAPEDTAAVVPEPVAEEVVPPVEAVAPVPEEVVEAPALEAEAPAAVTEVEAPAVVTEAEVPAPVAPVNEVDEPVIPTEAPLTEPETAAVEEPAPEDVAETAPAAFIEETPVEEQAVQPEPAVEVVAEAPAPEPVLEAEPAPVEEELVAEPVEVAAALEPAEEPVVETVEAVAASEPTAEPVTVVEAAVEEPVAVVEESAPAAAEEAVEEPEPAEPVEPEVFNVAETEPEVPSIPEPVQEAPTVSEPEPTVVADETPAPAISEEAVPEEVVEEEVPEAEEVPAPAPVVEEVKDEEDTVVEDIAAPTAEEVIVEEAAAPVPTEATEEAIPELAAEEAAEEPAAPASVEEPVVEDEPEEAPVPEGSPIVEEPAPEAPAAEEEAEPVAEAEHAPVEAEPETVAEPEVEAAPEVEVAPEVEAEPAAPEAVSEVEQEPVAPVAEETPALSEPEVEVPVVVEESEAEKAAPEVPAVEDAAPAEPATEIASEIPVADEEKTEDAPAPADAAEVEKPAENEA